MRIGIIPFFFASKPYITGITAGWLVAYPPAIHWFLGWLILNPEDGGDMFL
jgi:hypothetical protein